MMRNKQSETSKGGGVLNEDEILWQSATLRIILTLALIFGLSPTLKTTRAFADDASQGSKTEQTDKGNTDSGTNGDTTDKAGTTDDTSKGGSTTETKEVLQDSEGNKYSTLKEAFEKAASGSTITMLDDMEEVYGAVVQDKTLTLDMNGKTITSSFKSFTKDTYNVSPGNRVIAVREGGNLTITGNGTIVGPVDNVKDVTCGATDHDMDSKALILVENSTTGTSASTAEGKSATLTIENGTFKTGVCEDKKHGFYGLFVRWNGNVILGKSDGTGPTFETGRSCIGENNTQPTANVTVYGGLYKCLKTVSEGKGTDCDTKEETPFAATASGNINIYGGTFEGTNAMVTRYKTTTQNILITDGNFIGSSTAESATGGKAILKCDDTGKDETKTKTASVAADTTTSTRTFKILGGTYSSELDSSIIGTEYKCEKGADGKYSIKAADDQVVAKIGDNTYAHLKDAFTAVKDGETIQLQKDTTDEYGMSVDGKTVTLDMNGKTITSGNTSSTYTAATWPEVINVVKGGNLTIKGGGKIVGPTSTCGKNLDTKTVIAVKGDGDTFSSLTIEDAVEITCGGEGSDGMYAVSGFWNANIILGKQGSTTGPKITAHFSAVSGNNMNPADNITIYGGEYKSTANPVKTADKNELNWWYYFCAPVYVPANGNVNIYGGTFEGYYGFVTRYKNTDQTVNITGGTFKGTGKAVLSEDKDGSGPNQGTREVEITGGNYNTEIDSTLLKTGYELQKKESDNTYDVVEKKSAETDDDGVVDLGEVKFTVTENDEGLKGVVITKDETSEGSSLMTLKASNGDSYTAKLPSDASGQIVKFETSDPVNLKVNDNVGKSRVITGKGTNTIVAQASRSITYKTQGGTLSSKSTLPKTFTTGIGADLKTTSSVNIPTRKGYKFLGWYANAKGTGTKVTKVSTAETENVTLYAKWSMSAATVNTITGNGTVKVNGQEVTAGQSIDLTSSTMTISWLPGVDAGGTNVSLIKSIKVNGVDQGAVSKIDKTKWQEDNTLYQQIMNESGIKMTTWAGVVGTEQSITVTGIDTSKDVAIDVEFEEYTPVYRLYNTFTSEHLFTTDKVEYDDFVDLCEKGEENWIGEGIDWFAPKSTETSTHVVRLYNAALGALGRTSHYYTSDESEIQELTTKYGWKNEESSGKSFASGGDTAIYTCYNELLGSAHHYTSSKSEWEGLANHGWDLEKSKNVGSGKNGVFQAVMSAKPE